MGKITQPGRSIKLSNVSLVKLKKGGKRFEIATYPNKVSEWRKGTEKDLDNVLQIQSVYTNVSKGQLAGSAELEAAFGTSDVMKIIIQILEKGELQLGEKERNAVLGKIALESLFKDIANIIAEKTINPETKRPYTATMIEKVLSDIHFNPNPNKTSKQLALDAIKLIEASNIIPIVRVMIRLRVSMPATIAKKLKDSVIALTASVESEDWDNQGDFELIAIVEPGQFKAMTDLISRETKGKGVVELLTTQQVDDAE